MRHIIQYLHPSHKAKVFNLILHVQNGAVQDFDLPIIIETPMILSHQIFTLAGELGGNFNKSIFDIPVKL